MTLHRICIIAAAFGVALISAAKAEETLSLTGEVTSFEGKSPDYKRGFCDGFNLAAKQSQANRDHFMRMSSHPFETHDQAMARIGAHEWAHLHDDLSTVDALIAYERDAVDLYVVLPAEIGCP